MNWQEIKEKYPRSYNLIYQQAREYANVLYESPIRWLYDFFDEQGISVTIDWSHSEKPTIGIDWYYEITDFGLPAQIFECVNVYAGNRTEAEEQAFLKAFEILEEKLI